MLDLLNTVGMAERPHESVINGLVAGDAVRLVFVGRGGSPREKMWVKIKVAHREGFEGHLMDTPLHLTGAIKRGALVAFVSKHILAAIKNSSGPGSNPYAAG